MGRDRFLVSQHRDADKHDIDMWFWTYHIRKNKNYQGEWSLLHMLSPWARLWRSDTFFDACQEAVHSIWHGLLCMWYQVLSGSFFSPWHFQKLLNVGHKKQ